MKKLKPSFVALVMLLTIMFVAFIFFPSTQSSANQHIPGHAPVIPYAPGVPAITPSHTGNGTTIGTSVAVSPNDVTQYVTSFGLPRCSVINGGHLKVMKVLLVTAQEASVLLGGEYIGRPDNALVYYVEVYGPFTTNVQLGPSVSTLSTTAQTSRPFAIGQIVFDASTGNLLLWGIPPQTK